MDMTTENLNTHAEGNDNINGKANDDIDNDECGVDLDFETYVPERESAFDPYIHTSRQAAPWHWRAGLGHLARRGHDDAGRACGKQVADWWTSGLVLIAIKDDIPLF